MRKESRTSILIPNLKKHRKKTHTLKINSKISKKSCKKQVSSQLPSLAEKMIKMIHVAKLACPTILLIIISIRVHMENLLMLCLKVNIIRLMPNEMEVSNEARARCLQ